MVEENIQKWTGSQVKAINEKIDGRHKFARVRKWGPFVLLGYCEQFKTDGQMIMGGQVLGGLHLGTTCHMHLKA
jgi:hypothetical protein